MDFWSCWKMAWLDGLRLILKLMTSQPGKQATEIHILPNTSRSKGNPTMKIGQLIEYNMRNIFLTKSYTKCGGVLPDLFLKYQIWAYLWINSLPVDFIICQVQCFRNTLKLSCKPLAFTSYKVFLKNKDVWN